MRSKPTLAELAHGQAGDAVHHARPHDGQGHPAHHAVLRLGQRCVVEDLVAQKVEDVERPEPHEGRARDGVRVEEVGLGPVVSRGCVDTCVSGFNWVGAFSLKHAYMTYHNRRFQS